MANSSATLKVSDAIWDNVPQAAPRSATQKPLLTFDKFRTAYDAGLDIKWQASVLKKVTELLKLPADWDGYGAPAIRRDAAMFALEVLETVMLPRTPLPAIVPAADGGIQIEWHEGDIDLEFHVSAPYACDLWFEDLRGAEESISEVLTNDFTLLRSSIAHLSKR